jgi:four helix bundle protein
MQDYRKLSVWRKARALTVAVHELMRVVPSTTAPGLRPQLMRATMSIAANVAEGAMRESRVDFARFITIAISTSSEAEHHLITCGDLGFLDRPDVERLANQIIEVRRMLFGLRAALLRREQEERIRGKTPSQRQPIEPQ